ncbi:MAG TPA: hypothetical protein VK823_08030 [Streptosporangiaceae bacterium]|jgi:hypothetical protein|nr:hypothetical protein [Streptosporangiaceae bacterium]
MTASAGNGTFQGEAARPQTAERITVALIPKAAEDLQNLQDRTGLSKTDITNRAISLYEFIDAQLRADRDVLIRDNVKNETQIIRLL